MGYNAFGVTNSQDRELTYTPTGVEVSRPETDARALVRIARSVSGAYITLDRVVEDQEFEPERPDQIDMRHNVGPEQHFGIFVDKLLTHQIDELAIRLGMMALDVVDTATANRNEELVVDA